jgi:hypothetical protein
VLIGAAAAAAGRLVLALGFRRLRRHVSDRTRANLAAAGKVLTLDRKRSVAGLGLFALSLLPFAQLFEAAGLIGVALLPLTAAFFAARRDRGRRRAGHLPPAMAAGTELGPGAGGPDRVAGGGDMTVLVGHANAHGSTREIAERIAARLSAQGLPVEIHPMDQAQAAAGYDAFVLGSAIHGGDWLPEAATFLGTNINALGPRMSKRMRAMTKNPPSVAATGRPSGRATTAGTPGSCGAVTGP